MAQFEIAWYAHEQGQLAEDYFESWTRRMHQLAEEKSFQRMLRDPAMKIMHDGFERYIRTLLTT